jgi:hypothetical protein
MIILPVAPSMPLIGLPERHYMHLARMAASDGDSLSRDAAKVGQYVTLANNPSIQWCQKLRYYQHALERHCVPPRLADDTVWLFYKELAHFVRSHAGWAALRLASHEDDRYAQRQASGESREKLADDAEEFFGPLVPAYQTNWLNREDYEQLKLLRDQWV